MAIEAQELEIQIGARTLLHPTNFHVAKATRSVWSDATAPAKPR